MSAVNAINSFIFLALAFVARTRNVLFLLWRFGLRGFNLLHSSDIRAVKLLVSQTGLYSALGLAPSRDEILFLLFSPPALILTVAGLLRDGVEKTKLSEPLPV